MLKRILTFVCSTLLLHSEPLPSKKGKVVLIHGIVVHNSMSSLHRHFKREGWEVLDWRYPSREKSISDHGKDLSAALKNFNRDEKTPIHYIAFSLGGLVLRSALQDETLPFSAKNGKIVLVSSPINGSKLARSMDFLPLAEKVLGKHAGKELLKTPKKIFSEQQFPENIPILVLSGTLGFNPVFSEPNDGKVSISESCPKNPHIHKYIYSGHSWICRNPKVFDEAIEFFTHGSSLPPCTIH